MATNKKTVKSVKNSKSSSGAKVPVKKAVASKPGKKPSATSASKANKPASAKKPAPSIKGGTSKKETNNNSKKVKNTTKKTVPTKKAATVKKSAPAKKATVASKPVIAKKTAKPEPKKAEPKKEAAAKVVTKPEPKKAEPKAKVETPAKPKAANAKQIAAFTAKTLAKSMPVRPLPAPAPRVKEEKKPGIIVAHRKLENKSKPVGNDQGMTMINYQPDFTRSILDEPEQQQGPVYRYSDEELSEFKDLITSRLDAARKELVYLQGLITRKDEAGTEDTENRYMNMEDGSGAMEREQLAQLASRQIQFINHLEKALVRIENKTYGICRVTGKLIDKNRLRAVPHATLSIEAKKFMANKQ
jgi:RNA polymerase-binding transcription factor DksA